MTCYSTILLIFLNLCPICLKLKANLSMRSLNFGYIQASSSLDANLMPIFLKSVWMISLLRNNLSLISFPNPWLNSMPLALSLTFCPEGAWVPNAQIVFILSSEWYQSHFQAFKWPAFQRQSIFVSYWARSNCFKSPLMQNFQRK